MINYLILASGKGERFKNAGFTTIKPLIELNGKRLLQHVLDNYGLSPTDVCLALPEPILHEQSSAGIDLRFKSVFFVSDTDGPMTSLSQVLSFNFFKGGPLVVLDCDCWLNRPTLERDIREVFDNTRAGAFVYRAKYSGNYSHFTCPMTNAGQFIGFEHPTNPEFVNPGCYVFRNASVAKTLIRNLGVYDGEPTIPRLLAHPTNAPHVHVVDTDASFTSVGTPEEYEEYNVSANNDTDQRSN